MRLYVVGIGPGGGKGMTLEAKEALQGCEVIVGYTVYLDLVRGDFPDKEYVGTGMRGEVERCLLALEKASCGRKVAVVCSGDAGVYGMAGILLELAPEYPEVEVVVVPGVTAALSGAALLGAPLGHDFAVISLSDLLTDWADIEKRILYAARADFAICLYNPSSRKRGDYLRRACDLVLSCQNAGLVCGYAQNIGRGGQRWRILTLEELRQEAVDMFTTVFIGNSQTRRVAGRMVTPRGYDKGSPFRDKGR